MASADAPADQNGPLSGLLCIDHSTTIGAGRVARDRDTAPVDLEGEGSTTSRRWTVVRLVAGSVTLLSYFRLHTPTVTVALLSEAPVFAICTYVDCRPSDEKSPRRR